MRELHHTIRHQYPLTIPDVKSKSTLSRPEKRFRIGIAETEREKRRAQQIVYNTYLSKGFIEPNSEQIRRTPYDESESNILFIGRLKNEIIVTATAFPDEYNGLPMDSIFSREIEFLRQKGRRLVEVGSLASLNNERRIIVLFQKAMIRHVTNIGYDDMVVLINPKHAAFCYRYHGFEVLSQPKPYPAVNNNPAVAMRLRLNK